jgi:proteasome accessory factor B
VDRLERLVNLVVALLDTPKPLTREELRQRVGGYSEDPSSFRRAFERDKELLREMGIPVLATTINAGAAESQVGYWAPRELYEMADPGLDEEELMALSLAASLVGFRGDGGEEGAATAALRKLAGPVTASSRPGGPVVDVALGPELATLFSGIAERRTVSFRYNDAGRRVDPYRLSYREGHWYLGGFDHARNAERLFRVDRMSGQVVLQGAPGAFERPAAPPGGPPPPWRLGNDDAIVVDLRVDAGQAPWVQKLAGDSAVERTGPEGDVYFRLEVTNREGFRSFLLGLLDHAEVVSPPEVRGEIVSWLEAVAAGGPGGRRALGEGSH